jgi:hypothetical protein
VKCPACKKEMGALAVIDGNKDTGPKQGDIAICCSCSMILTFKSDLSLRTVCQEELDSLPTEAIVNLMIFMKFVEDQKAKIKHYMN